jgi:hypothetical protein
MMVVIDLIFVQIRIYGDDKAKLHSFFPPDILPEDFGGKQPPYSNKVCISYLSQYTCFQRLTT